MNAVFIIFDPSYFHYAQAFVASCKTNSPYVKMVVFMVNPSEEMLNWCNDKRIEHVIINKTFPSGKRRRNYIVTRRFEIFLKYMNEHKDIKKVMMIDCDAIIRKDISCLFPLVNKYELALDYAAGRSSRTTISGGLVLVRNNSKGRMFFDEYVKQMGELPVEWYQDQYALYYTFEKLKNKIRWCKLPHNTHSTRLNNEHMIYQARGKSRKERWSEKTRSLNSNDKT